MLLLVLTSFAARAQLSTLETNDLRLIYEGTRTRFLAPHVARCFENSLRFHRRLWGWSPSEKVTVVLSDFSDYGNAGAGGVPHNVIGVQIAPISFAYETYSANERMSTLMNHELVHIVTVDQATGRDRFFRSVFGGKVRARASHPESILFAYLTSPRDSAPRWYHEGIAVFVETWMAGGIGRAQGAFDEMVFRSMVRDGTGFFDPIALESKGVRVDFQAGVNAYLYGTRFLSYLAYRYSPETLIEWASRRPGSSMYFAAQFEKVYGRSLDELWAEWVEWEQGFQSANLDSIRRYPTTEYHAIPARPLGSVSRAFLDEDGALLHVAVNYPGTIAHVASISTRDGAIRRLTDVKGPTLYTVTSLAFDPGTRTLFYTTDNGDWRDLVMVSADGRGKRTLLEDARVGDLVFVPRDRAIWGIRHFNGVSTLVRVPHPYDRWQQVYTWPYGRVVYDIDVSADGRRLSAAIGEIDGRQRLHLFEVDDLLAGTGESKILGDFGASLPANFVFSPDGRYLYGSSYYTGVSNIWRYNFDADSMEVVSNCETGFFRPTPVTEDSLVVFRYTGEGFAPATMRAEVLTDVSATTFLGQMIAREHPVVTSWGAGSPSRVDIDSLVTSEGSYRALAELGLESVHPIVEGYKDYPAYGLQLNVSDPLSLHRLGLSASYTPNGGLDEDERLHVGFDYERFDWNLSARYNGADFYDLFGPTKTSRKGYSLELGYTKELIYDPPRKMTLSASIGGYGGLERLPDYQNVASSFDELLSGDLSLDFENKRASLGAVDWEKGYGWGLSLMSDYVNRRAFPKALGTADVGVPLFITHSSLWLRTSAGYSPRERDDPFANFFFGGFGNNWVDHRTVERYQSYYAFPGVDLNEVAGTNHAKATLDWLLPPLRFSRVGSQTLYANWMRLALFSSGIATNLDDEITGRELIDVGGQLDIRLTLLSILKLTLSAGYAVAMERDRSPTTEHMFSLKIL